VLLLDIVPKDAGSDKKSRNKIVDDALAFALKSNPSPIYRKSFAKRIVTGNFDDNMKDIANCDWIIEVVIERLDIKKQVFDNVEKYRKPGTLISSNTSGIPIHLMNEGRSEDFQKHFCGTHFFNPPRYLKLLEIIPTPKTSPEVIDFLMKYGELYLGKTMVLCKDTPAFIANRIGVFGIMSLFHMVEKMGLTVDEVDKLTGPVLGRPKSATFRTCDVVGLDTLVHVANGLAAGVPNDEAKEYFKLPSYVAKMVENKWLGSKTEQGFFKKVKGANGKSEIHSLDLKTLEYKPSVKAKFATLEKTKTIDNLRERVKVLAAGTDKAGEFYRATFYGLFAYVSNRIPEITDELFKIDDAMKAGFGWDLGPFEYWDALGVAETVKAMEAAGNKPSQWIYDMLSSGATAFYKLENGSRKYYDIPSKSYKVIPGTESFILLDNIRPTKTVWKNSGATLTDIGDGIVNLEWNTKMNSIGAEVIEGINKSIEIAEKDFRGLVISNEGANFSAGANVGMIFMMAVEQEYDELNFAIKTFQNTMMRVRYSSIPVVVAPHNLALGGACEMSLHSDRVVAHAETYMGLVEVGVGLIPGAGGVKEFVRRIITPAIKLAPESDPTPYLQRVFEQIGMAKVGTSAFEARDQGFVTEADRIVMNGDELLGRAKQFVLDLAAAGFTPPAREKLYAAGRDGLAAMRVGVWMMQQGGYISEYDAFIGNKLAYAIAGGDLSSPQWVDEEHFLAMEREVFLALCREPKTMERIMFMLQNNKPLRN
ncbi:MAG: 3-hydroxyacyl-CoA dehydrogenase/enoyl-CoA hydratase family protein, partial [Chloroflexi bacterium]|nr:3-hydroxyacyl-CoA dehydrogenase/enoyl-CoA hydratase family protein [Chloroflexota bacterium]